MKNNVRYVRSYKFALPLFLMFSILFSLTFTSCSTTNGYSEYERTEAAFLDKLGGDISSSQYWRTAVTLKVDVKTDTLVKIWVMSDNDSGTLYDYRAVTSDSLVDMCVPQGKGTTVYVVSVCRKNKQIQSVTLTGKTEESVTINTTSLAKSASNGVFVADDGTSSAKALVASRKATTDRSVLYGKSILGESKQLTFTDAQRAEAVAYINNYYQESKPAKEFGLNCDYEFKSNGDFDITFLTGNCLSGTSHILGYYYHTPGSYDDIKYVDITETEIYDYIDDCAKMQYKVDGAMEQEYKVEKDHWYDANFDMYDTFTGAHPSISARLGDDAYNAMAVLLRYGSHITDYRGISFTIKVPVGMCIGFYDRSEEVSSPEQYDRFIKLGVKPYTTREKYKAMNFTCEQMNVKNKGSYRATIIPYKDVYWLGMENDYTGGDLDCNDVIFGVSAELEIYQPSIVEPDLQPFGEYDDKMPWTLAFEDVGRDADFDFNDAVIKLTPDYENEKCCVTVEAAGSDCRMYLHYDGPDGDQNLGEVHELLNGSTDSKINTTNSVAGTPFVEVDCVNWPKTYDMTDDAKRFYIEIQRGTCEDCTDIISLTDTPGVIPEALLVAGEWNWPMEGVNICSSYNKFINWAKNSTKTTYWNWYESAKSGTTVEY